MVLTFLPATQCGTIYIWFITAALSMLNKGKMLDILTFFFSELGFNLIDVSQSYKIVAHFSK
jgi:hypothetical protein